ncbi:MAG: DNA mismatch repair protein MutS, partial [Oscillospiraceae bacterium]|nr:DNA mismatch repair protein MutS [Oscillospiraceae bacterium]
LDKTRTSMGARLLRKWVEQPLLNANQIILRQNAVGELFDNFMLREEISDLLKSVLDLERIMTRIVYGTANGRDMRAVAATISTIPKMKTLLEDSVCDELKNIYNELDELEDIYTLIDEAIVEEPPFSVREGGFIKAGYNVQLDEYNSIMTDGKGTVERIENTEREKSGIRNLKIGYNRIFGYYIEITKSYTGNVPQNYIRKQTLANCERYITPELKEIELTLLGASDKAVALEYELFNTVRVKVAENVARIQTSAVKLALLDVYLSLAEVAANNKYVKPDIEYNDVIKIKDGRHPVVEKFADNFVPNDTVLDVNNNRLMLITGPNMAGKSTYMRQVALIAIIAQMGSFVPAKEAEIGIVDKIFTRVGASDDLASGQSTFMLEMNEVAYILKNATRRSLIIYDEIGRGTSTFDGMSIARAVAEYTQSKKIGAKTLFATHYHEMTDLESQFQGVVNYNIAAKKRGDELIFLRKIIPGAADDSYGIEVAKLAGVPNEIIRRAKEILKTLEEQSRVPRQATIEENANVTFEDFKKDEILAKLKKIDVNLISPMDAWNIVQELKKIAE